MTLLKIGNIFSDNYPFVCLKVCICLGASIILPFWLSGIRLSLTCPGVSLGLDNKGLKKKLFCYMVDQLFWLFHPIFISFQLTYSQIKIEMMLGQKNVNGEVFTRNIERKEKLFLYLKNYKKMELNIETIFQMTGKIILLALVWSETRTSHGLLTVFENKDVFNIPAELFIALSVMFSFVTFTFAQTAGIAGRRVYFPIASRLLIGFSALFSCLIRVMCFVLFFSPCLGLWNLLRHYQG